MEDRFYAAAGKRGPVSGVSLFGNRVLLGITEGYVDEKDLPHICRGVEFYITIPKTMLQITWENHRKFSPSPITERPWGVSAFRATICGHAYLIAGEE